MNALLIYNPAAGQGAGESNVSKIREAFRAVSQEIFVTRGAGEAKAAAQKAARRPDLYDGVLVAGGDGTVNEVINGIQAADAPKRPALPIGIIPQGTRNILARDLGIPKGDLAAQASIVAGKKTRVLDLGLAGDRYFSLVAGFGFDAAVVSEVLLPVKDLIGPAAYAFAALGALAKYRSTHFRLVLDGQCIESEAYLVLAANVPSYAFLRLRPAPFASPVDGWMDICVFEKAKGRTLGFVGQLAAVWARRHLRDPRVRYYRARRIEIFSEPPVQAQLDGDLVGHTPLVVEVVPKALSVFVP